MKTILRIFGIFALVALIGFAFFACDSSGAAGGGIEDDGRETGIYETVRSNVTFTLTITPGGGARSTYLTGDTYVLVVKEGETEQISSGVVADVREIDVVLQPSFKDAPPFTVRKNSSNGTKTSITGTITFDDGETRGGFAAASGGGGGGGSRGGGSSGGGGGGPTTPTYTVTFDTDGGSAVAAITGLTSGSTITAPAAPTKEFTGSITTPGLYFGAINDYTFVEWRRDGTAFDFATPITENITLTAHWTAPTPIGGVAENNIGAAFTRVTQDGVANEGHYTLLLNTNVNSAYQVILPAAANRHLTIIGLDSMRTITFNGLGTNELFNISSTTSSITLGNNITLTSISNSERALVFINRGTFTMESGSRITGHTNTSNNQLSAAVEVGGADSHFIMNGGTIDNNRNSSPQGEGGVRIRANARFTMTGGTITGNTRTTTPTPRDLSIAANAGAISITGHNAIPLGASISSGGINISAIHDQRTAP